MRATHDVLAGSSCAAVVPIDRALRRRRLDRVSVLTRRDLMACWTWYRRRNVRVAGTVQVLQRFLTHRGLLGSPESERPSRRGARLAAYTTYLRDVRGLDPATIHQHVATADEFLRHVKYETHPTRLAALSASDLEAFVRRAGARLRRGTLQHVVARVRGLLRFLASVGAVRPGLDTQIDTPRVYRLERLPRTLPWDTVHALLRSIDRTTPIGLRDYTMFFLVATYGLRACEIVALTLDDLDWRAGVLRVPPRKHGTPLLLPLTDAAGTVLLHYLRRGRPSSSHRELFLRRGPRRGSSSAPRSPTPSRPGPAAVDSASPSRARTACGIRTPCTCSAGASRCGPSGRSWAIGVRTARASTCAWRSRIYGVSPCHSHARAPARVGRGTTMTTPRPFSSAVGPVMTRYLALKQALGRRYANERAVLQSLDAFLAGDGGRRSDLTLATFTRLGPDPGAPHANRPPEPPPDRAQFLPLPPPNHPRRLRPGSGPLPAASPPTAALHFHGAGDRPAAARDPDAGAYARLPPPRPTCFGWPSSCSTRRACAGSSFG